jgi:hypothetical protein
MRLKPFLKFWIPGARSKVRELEQEFIDYANWIDSELLDFHYNSEQYTPAALENKRALLSANQRVVENLSWQYEEYFVGPKKLPPEYDKFYVRFTVLWDKIYWEFQKRQEQH